MLMPKAIYHVSHNVFVIIIIWPETIVILGSVKNIFRKNNIVEFLWTPEWSDE